MSARRCIYAGAERYRSEGLLVPTTIETMALREARPITLEDSERVQEAARNSELPHSSPERALVSDEVEIHGLHAQLEMLFCAALAERLALTLRGRGVHPEEQLVVGDE